MINPAGCRGGEICDTQPTVLVIDEATQQIDFFFDGSIYVQLGESPTGYEDLYIGGSCDYESCGQKVVGTLASATVVEGLATFEVSLLLLN